MLTDKGHKYQQKMHFQSTKILPNDPEDMWPKQEDPKNGVFLAFFTVDSDGFVYTYLTINLLTSPINSIKYSISMYQYDTNNILTRTIKTSQIKKHCAYTKNYTRA